MNTFLKITFNLIKFNSIKWAVHATGTAPKQVHELVVSSS